MQLPIEPSPAVPRAIAILRLLNQHGPLVRDDIAQRLDIPRTTCLRILAGLRQQHVIEADRIDGRWWLRERLAPMLDGKEALFPAGDAAVTALTASGSHVIEVYVAQQGRLRLIYKQPAADAGLNTRVEPGWVYDLRDYGCRRLALEQWAHLTPDSATANNAAGSKRSGLVYDQHFSKTGVLRQGMALMAGSHFRGLVVAAQLFQPQQQERDQALGRLLQKWGKVWRAALQS